MKYEDAEKVIEILVNRIKELETDLFIEKIKSERKQNEKVEKRPSTNKAEETR